MKRCREITATCARCSSKGHKKDKCTSTEVRCCHCGVDHKAFSRNCAIFKRETEIVQIQTKERAPRLQALRKLLRLNPNPDLIFSNAIKNTSNPTASKYPTRSQQESQSSCSEDTNVTQFFFDNFGNEEHNSPTVPSYGHAYYTKGKLKIEMEPTLPTTNYRWRKSEKKQGNKRSADINSKSNQSSLTFPRL